MCTPSLSVSHLPSPSPPPSPSGVYEKGAWGGNFASNGVSLFWRHKQKKKVVIGYYPWTDTKGQYIKWWMSLSTDKQDWYGSTQGGTKSNPGDLKWVTVEETGDPAPGPPPNVTKCTKAGSFVSSHSSSFLSFPPLPPRHTTP